MSARGGPSGKRSPSEAGVDASEPREVPSDAYVVTLPTFEGPLDLLLQIILRHELDILELPIGFITEKYLEYLAVIKTLTIDLASEYLVMAATLALIKSKMLLPDLPSAGDEATEEGEEADPRAELVRRLLEYQKYKAAGEVLQTRDTLGTAVFPRGTSEEVPEGPAPFAPFGVIDLLEAFSKILGKTKVRMEHEIVFDRIGITERIVEMTDLLRERRNILFSDVFLREGRTPTRFDLVITFLAILEMCRLRMMRVVQTDTSSPIHLELLVLDDDGDSPIDERDGSSDHEEFAEEPGEAAPSSEADFSDGDGISGDVSREASSDLDGLDGAPDLLADGPDALEPPPKDPDDSDER